MKQTILGAVMAVLATACGVGESRITDLGEDITQSGSGLTWEQFRATKVFQEPESGLFIADGDTLFESEKQLREFYELNVREGQLIVNRVGSADDKWSNTAKLNISYCVSDSFGTRKATVVQGMAQATGAWEAAANVKFNYLSQHDANCTASNSGVVFDVRPVNVNGQYLARAFFPSNSRSARNVLLDNSMFTSSGVSFVGVIRHELGHVLGFRHEHTRPQAGATDCFEDNQWRELTSYDSASVMHYPQCNGTNSFSVMNLTTLDKQGAAALYGAPSTGGTGGGAGGGGGSTGGGAGGGGGSGGGTGAGETTENFSGSVAQGANQAYGPFTVTAGTTFRAALSGSGDADLFVRFGSAPTASSYDCRPYLNGSAETCELSVPTGVTSAYIVINGYTASSFSLAVTYTKGGTTPPPSGGTPQTATASGSVSRGQLLQFNPITVKPGSTLTVAMTGSGDPDLYVRFAGAPSLTVYDCRPYKSGAAETCSLTVPATATQFYMAVNGYQAGNYNLTVNYVAP